MYRCAYVCTCVYMHVVAEVGMGLPLSLSALFFEAGSLAQFELTEWARLEVSKPEEFSSSPT